MNNRLTHLVTIGLFAAMSVVAGCGGGGSDGQSSTSRKLLTGSDLSITPKQSDCKTPIADLTTSIVRYPSSAGPQEMKGWLAFVQYLSALRSASGTPAIPAVYSSAQGRIVR